MIAQTTGSRSLFPIRLASWRVERNLDWITSLPVALACELPRDWVREETVADVVEIVLTERLLHA